MDEINLNSPIPTSPAKKTGIILKIIAGIVVLGVVGAGVCLGTRIWDPLWNPFRPSPEKVIDEMTINMKEVRSLHTDTEINLWSEQEAKTTSEISLIINNDSNLEDLDNPKTSGSFLMRTTSQVETVSQGPEFSVSGKIRSIGDASYFKIDEIPLQLQFLLAFQGINADEVIGNWIKVDKEGLENLMKQKYSTPQGLEIIEQQQEEQKVMIEKIQKILEGKKLYYPKELPDEEIGDQKTYHYLLILNKEEIKNIIPDVLEIIFESAGNGLIGDGFQKAFLIGGITNSIEEFLNKIGELSAEVWIGKKDLLLYRVRMEKEMDLSEFEKSAKGIISVSFEINLTEFDQSILIEAPESSIPFEEIIPKEPVRFPLTPIK